MANPKFRYQHLRSATANSVPSAATLKEGEIAVNYLKDAEKLFIKNSANEVVAFITSGAVTTLINNANTVINNNIQYISGAVDTVSGAVDDNAADIQFISGAVDTVSGAVDTINNTTIPNLANSKFGAVEYVSTAKTIYFYDNSTTNKRQLGTIDTTDFIKDGMVQNVEIKDVSGSTCLVVTFNTDAGHEDINIPLTDIFDPSNYYTKAETSGATEIQNALDLKANQSDFAAHSADTSLHFSGNEKDHLDSLATNIATISGISASDVNTWNTVTAKTDNDDFTAHTADTSVHIQSGERDTWNTVTAKTDNDDFTAHTTDAAIHVTAAKQEAWNEVSAKTNNTDFVAHSGNTDMHVTTADKTLWNNAITGITVNGGNEVPVSSNVAALTDVASDAELTTLSGTVTAHTANTNIHLTSTEKTNIDSISGNVGVLSAITQGDVTNWNNAFASAHTHDNMTALNSITGNVGSMAYENVSSYSSATEVNTALGGKQDTLSDDQSTGNIKTVVNKSLLGTGNVPINIVELSDVTVEGSGENQTVIFDAGTF